MTFRRGIVIGLFLTAIVTGAVAWQIGKPPQKQRVRRSAPQGASPRAAKPPRPPDDYVGSARCATCHAEIAASYQQHPMSRSLSSVSSNAPYFVDASLEPGGMCTYVVDAHQGRLRHHELMRDDAGEVIYDQPFTIDYAIGSGIRGHSFLVFRNDLMFMSPLTWYTGASKWDLSPTYVADDVRRFTRRVTGDCLHCHAGQVNVKSGEENRFQAQPFVEMSIGCERCHGPGKAHVEYRESGMSKGQDLMVNPATLAPAQRESICNQCHLQAEARLPRYGRTQLDFRPGQNLADVITVLHRGDHGKGARAVHQVQQMRASRCFQASAGKLGCISCHDPHSVPAAEEKVEFYRQKCIACHAAEPHCALPQPERVARYPNDSCIECHMPRIAAADVAHTAQTDHRVLRDPSAATPETDGEEFTSRPEMVFGDGMKEPLEPWEADRALGLALYQAPVGRADRSAHLRRLETLLTPAAETAPDDLPVLLVLAAIYQEQGRTAESQSYYEEVLRHDPNNEGAVMGLGQLAYTAQDFPAALRYFNRFLALNDSSAEVYGRKAEVLGLLEDWPAGIAAAEQGLEVNPRLVSLRAWLVDAYQHTGQTDKAKAHYTILSRMRTVWRMPQ